MPIDCESMSVASGKGGRWPPQVEDLVARIRDDIREAAGSALAGLYLFGSLVVGDFDVDVSDIDLIAVLTSAPSDDLVARLGRMHDALASENARPAGTGIRSQFRPSDGLCGSYPKADTGSIGGFRPARREVVPKSACRKLC